MQCIDFTLSLDLSMGWFQIVCNGSQWTIWYNFGEKKIDNVAKQYIVSVLENRTGFLQLFLSGLFIQIIGWGWRSGQPLIRITDRLFLYSSKCHRRLASFIVAQTPSLKPILFVLLLRWWWLQWWVSMSCQWRCLPSSQKTISLKAEKFQVKMLFLNNFEQVFNRIQQ